MNAQIESLEFWPAYILELAIKSTVLLLVGFAIHRLLRRSSAPTRSIVWNVVLLGLMSLPLLSICLPDWSVFRLRQGRQATTQHVTDAMTDATFKQPDKPPGLPSDEEVEIAETSVPAAATAATLQRNAQKSPSSLLPALLSAFVGIIAAGMGLCLCKVMMDVAAVRRLRDSSFSVASCVWLERLEHWTSRLKIHASVTLRQSDQVDAPTVLGVDGAVIVLPSALMIRAERTFIDSVLVHELAHVLRHDYAWQLVFRFMRALYWYQPLVWLMERPMSLAREQACDEFAAYSIGDSDRYAATLLEIANSMTQRKLLTLGLAFARPSAIAQRLASLAYSGGRSSCKLTGTRAAQWHLAGLALVAILSLMRFGRGNAAAQAPETAANEAQPAKAELVLDRDDVSALPAGAVLGLGTRGFRQQGECTSVSYSADGSLLASTDERSVVIWDAATGRRKKVWEAGEQGMHVNEVAFAPQDNRVAAVWHTGLIRIRDLLTDKVVEITPSARIFSPTMTQKGLAFSPDGAQLASTFAQRLTIYDTHTGWPTRKLGDMKRGKPGRGVAWTPDGRYVAFGSFQPPAQLFDTTTGELVRAFNPDETSFSISLAISPDGKTLAAGCIRQGRGETMIYLWNLATGEQLAKLPSQDAVSVAFTPDSKLLVSATERGNIQVWDVDSHELKRTIEGGLGIARSAALSPDGTRVALGTVSTEIRQWDIATGERTSAVQEGHTSRVNSVAYSPDGRLIATGGDNREIRLWDADTGRQMFKLDSPNSANVVIFNRAGDRLATANKASGVFRTWNVANGEKVLELDTGRKRVRQIAYAPDGTRIVSVSADTDWVWSATHTAEETVDVWDANTGKKVGGFAFTASSTESAVVLAQGDSIAIGAADGSLQVFDLQTGALEKRLTDHTASLNAIALSADGGTLATGSRDETIRFWGTKDWNQLEVLDHGAPVTSLAFDAEKQRLVSCSDEEAIHVWDTERRQTIQVFGGFAGSTSVSIRPDGSQLVAGTNDGGVFVWKLP